MNGNISHLAVVGESFFIGRGSKVWHFANIEDDVRIGDGSVIGSHCFIGKGTRIGNGVRIQSFAFICRNVVIEDDVFIAAHVGLTDDKYPRSGNPGYLAQPPILRRGCSLGIGVLVMPGIEIGEGATVGAGAVVTRDVGPRVTVIGIPARARA